MFLQHFYHTVVRLMKLISLICISGSLVAGNQARSGRGIVRMTILDLLSIYLIINVFLQFNNRDQAQMKADLVDQIRYVINAIITKTY